MIAIVMLPKNSRWRWKKLEKEKKTQDRPEDMSMSQYRRIYGDTRPTSQEQTITSRNQREYKNRQIAIDTMYDDDDDDSWDLALFNICINSNM